MLRRFAIVLLALVALAFAAAPLALLGCAEVTVDPGPDPDCPVLNPPPAVDPPGPANAYGSRLAPFWRTYDDGTKVLDPARLWDSERGEPCSFVRIEGQGSRCLPAFVFNTKPGNFADPACTQPVLITDACAELPRYVRDESVKPWQTCEPAALVDLRPLGAPLVGGLYQVDPLGNCVAKAGTPDAANVALPIGEPIPLDAFVGGADGP